MTTTTTRSPGPRVDHNYNGKNGHGRVWLETDYPELECLVITAWVLDSATSPTPYSATHVYEAGEHTTHLYYDPARVTVGGLAEAHEAVCARVERGELP